LYMYNILSSSELQLWRYFTLVKDQFDALLRKPCKLCFGEKAMLLYYDTNRAYLLVLKVKIGPRRANMENINSLCILVFMASSKTLKFLLAMFASCFYVFKFFLISLTRSFLYSFLI
jgi:hypothetical protein